MTWNFLHWYHSSSKSHNTYNYSSCNCFKSTTWCFDIEEGKKTKNNKQVDKFTKPRTRHDNNIYIETYYHHIVGDILVGEVFTKDKVEKFTYFG